MNVFAAVRLRCRLSILAGITLLGVSACANQPAEIGTPAYALERLFSDRPYRSTDQMLAAHRLGSWEPESAPRGAAADEDARRTAEATADGGSQPGTPTVPSEVLSGANAASLPAAVTIIERSEYLVAGPAAYPYAWYAYPYYHSPRFYRPFRQRLYGPGGYQRCFGGCAGLSLSLGTGTSRFRLNARSFNSSSASTVLVQPPSVY